MLRIITVFTCLFLLKITLPAQTLCGAATDEPPGCLLDTIHRNGITNGFSTSPIVSNIDGNFCTSINGDQWYQFIPVCEEVIIKFRSVSCIPRIPTYGIGVAVMDENLVVQPFCFIFPAIGFGSRTLNVPDLIPGKRYTLMLYTAIAGQRCSYNFEIAGIATFGLDSPIIHGEFNIGTGSTTKYYVDKEPDGTIYKWTAPPGLTILAPDNSHEIMVNAPTAGTYLLCCDILRTDGSSSSVCKNVNVGNNSVIINYEKVLFCQDDCHNFNGECLDVPGHYYQTVGNTLNVLELCQNPEPQVGIYGAPEIVAPAEFTPLILNGYLDRGFGTDYTYQWFDTNGSPIPNSNSQQLSVDRSGTYCFLATNDITGCTDRTCVNVVITDPLPEPCGVAGDEPPGCALCGAVYTGSTAGYSRGPRPIGFCGTIENNQWLAFQASSTTATVSITSWNCAFGRGVQLYMIDTDGNPVSSCFSSGGNNLPGNISATGLTPGQVYYIMIDGFAGDICEFSITLLGGVNTGPPDTPGPIESDLDEPCPGQVVCYDIEPVENASNYEWLVSGDGQIIVGQGSRQACIQWGSSGIGEVCVVPLNPCFYGDTVCLQVDVVASSAVNDLPPMTFCESEFPIDPSTYCVPGEACPGIIPSPGKYCVNVGPSSTTCDSTICFTFDAIPITRTIVDTFFCEGDCLFWDNLQICQADTIEIPVPNGTACDDILELRVQEISVEAIINNARPYDCITGDTMWLEAINSSTGPGITYEWVGLDGGVVEDGADRLIAVIRGAGRYILTVKFGEGFDACVARDTMLVTGSLVPPIINCTSDGSSITFTWTPVPGAVDYNIDIDGIPQGTTNMTTYTVSSLAPLQNVTIGVQANGIPGCGSSTSIAECRAQDCPPLSVIIDSLPPICLGINDQPVQLTFQTPGGTGTGTTNWVSLGVSPTGLFDPKVVGAGTHNLDLLYGENGCNYIATRQVVVYNQPTATFDAETPICVTDDSEIQYTGNAAGNADFQWNLDGGITSGTPAANTFFTAWNAGGTYNISLQVTENGCASNLETQPVVVVDPLPKPELICAGSNTSSVEITWADVPGATDYDILILSGRTGIRTGNVYNVSDMNPGEDITLVLAASGNNICGPSLDTITCRAQDCPPVQVGIGGIAPICLYDDAVDFDLNDFLSLSGNTAGATVEWSSPTATVTPFGIFSPLNSGVGIFQIRVDITDEGCPFFAEAQIEIREVPEVDFTAPAEICITESATVESIGTTVTGADFSWNFGSGNSNNGTTGQGTFEISYSATGNEIIQFSAEAGGCFSDTLEKSIRITEPLPNFNIDCASTTNSINFSWNPTTGATDYQTQILNVPATATVSQPDDFNINFSDLNPLEEVTIQVTISDNNSSCPPTVVEKTCAAMNCPPIEIATLPVPQVCLNPGETGTPIDLNDFMTLTGDRGSAVIIWSGSTVSPQGIFEPNANDFGTHQMTVEVTEEGCLFTDLISVDVLKIPSSEFTADSPICVSGFSILELTTAAELDTDLFWNFGNSTNQGGSFPAGPLELTWSAATTDQVWLFTEKDNCVSDTTFVEIVIDPELIAPTIRCGSDLTQILFEWDDVPPATDYQVTIDDIPATAATSQPDNLSFLVENLDPLAEVAITVTASNALSACPPVSSSLRCIAAPCPPQASPIITCTAELTEILFEWDSIPGLDVYQVNIDDAPAGISSSQPDDFSILITGLLPNEEVTITVSANNSQSPCPPVSTTFTCEALPCPNMDISFPNLPDICLNEGIEPIDLSDYVVIIGALQNGTHTWAGAGITADGSFDPTIAGIGTHLMVFKYRELNCEYQENIEITIHPVPEADAGVDQLLTCLDTIAKIGGIRNASNPSVVEYEWTGGQVQNASEPKTQTTLAGTYTLTALNPITGCEATDSVVIGQGPTAPDMDASILDISCFGYNDGIIQVDTVLGGTPPFLFSFNDSPFLPHSEFQQLGPGDYQIRVRDAFGCTDEVFFSISEPDELTVELVIIADEIPVPFGDSIRLDAITNYAPEFLSNVQWSPVEQFPVCDETNITNCLSVFVTPTGQTVYTVRVEHLNGCVASDQGQILVSKDKAIYIPSGFSPNNNDGINDTFRIFADLNKLKNIRSFLVFDRWGELVHDHYNFLPEDDSHGWDGRLRGKKMSPNVFVYMVEVEFFDGSVELFKGDVTLAK